MKKIFLYLFLIVTTISCSDSFLERLPKGKWHKGNYTNENKIDSKILLEAKLAEAYATLRSWPFAWAGLAMSNYTTPDAEKGSTPSDGGSVAEFKSMSYTTENAQIEDFYKTCYKCVTFSNEAIALINTLPESEDAVKNRYLAEAMFLRSVMYYRLAQAFGGVSYIDKVLAVGEQIPARSSREEIWAHCETDLLWAIPHLPTRMALKASGNSGRATQNAARAVLAKVYLYQQKWENVLAQTNSIIASGDNNLSTAYPDIFVETHEYGPESIFEVYCDEKPDDKIYMGSQYGQVQGIRGVPNLGWGFNAPSQALMNAYEEGDPRKTATVIANGDVLDGRTVKADAAGYKFFNKKVYTPASERGVFGRHPFAQGQWVNIRVIRYADVLLMHAEAACESDKTDDAIAKLEMVRNRARGGNSEVLPKITNTNKKELRKKIRFERRIELALEWERFYDLVRWDEAKSVIPNFVEDKHELFPIPQKQIELSGGVLTQNPGY